MSQLINRMIRAAKLDPQLYEEIEADPGALSQSVIVVVLASIAAGIGSMFAGGAVGLLGGAILHLVGWFLWSGIVYLIGTKFLPEPQTQADYQELLRTIGFSASPGLLRVFGFVPLLGWILNLVVSVWMLIAFVIAVRQALDYQSTGRAIAVCVLGWLVFIVVYGILATMIGGADFIMGD